MHKKAFSVLHIYITKRGGLHENAAELLCDHFKDVSPNC